MQDGLALAVTHEPESAVDELFGLNEDALERVVACTLASAGIEQPVEVSLLLTGDEALRALNRDYRGLDKTTDVLSFPLLSRPLVPAPTNQLWQPTVDEDEDEDAPYEEGQYGPRAIPDSGELADQGIEDEDEDDEDEDDEDDDSGEFVFIRSAGEQVGLGDIAISRDAVRRQAAEAGHSPAYELAYLLAHGVLHLIGYDDHAQAGYQAMIAHQEVALACAGIE